MFDLYLIRHGQTPRNAEKRYPRPEDDAGLSEAGEDQAGRLKLPRGTAHVSPARRAMQTAMRAGFSELQEVPALAEAKFGIMAGHTWAELELAHGPAPAEWIAALSDPQSMDGPPGGETGTGFHTRVAGWLARLPDSGTVLAFTHLGLVLAALRLTVGLRAAEVPPCSVAHLRRGGPDWWLVSLTPGPGTEPA